MRLKRWLVVVVAGSFIFMLDAPTARAQSAEELKQRIQELERSTREQIDSLKRTLEQREAERTQQQRSQEEQQRTLESIKKQVESQQLSLQRQEERVASFLDGWENFFDLQGGRKQGAESERSPLGKDISGNVYAGDKFKIRLGGSLRLHAQGSDTPVGESVSRALLPLSFPGGGNNADRDNFRAFAGRTRLNLAIQGPTTLGGRTQGFVEADFNRQFTASEVGAVNNNPRLRHAFGRWSFDDLLTKGDELILTFGQTTSFADNVPDTIDFNTQLGGLGAALRRNPRAELVHKYPIGPGVKFVSSLGVERPFFDNAALGGDLGGGDLSGFPAVSGGIGLETDRIGPIGSAKIYLRTTWGEFEERFTGAGAVDNTAQVDFSERHFTNQTAWGTFTLDRIGFNTTGRAMTLQLRGGGLWTRGEARHLNAEFDRQIIRDSDGSLQEAESVGGFINPIFWITDTVSLRWAGGAQFALDNNRPVVFGSLISDGGPAGTSFFRVNNRQSEVSLWWTPGPFTFGVAYNHTTTDFRQVFPAGGSTSRENENNKIEAIAWFSF